MTRLLACFFLLSAALTQSAIAKDEDPVTRIEMKDVLIGSDATRVAGGPLSDVSVRLEAIREQKVGEQGLQLTVSIRNKGTKPLVLQDPSDYIQIQLLNARGFPVELPPIPTGGLSPRRPDGGGPSSDSEEDRPFEVVKPKNEPAGTTAGKPAADEPRMEQNRLLLPAGREYRLTLKIRKILADSVGHAAAVKDRSQIRADSGTPAAPPSATIAIPPDHYTVSLQIALVPMTDLAGSRQLESGPVVIDFKPQNTRQ